MKSLIASFFGTEMREKGPLDLLHLEVFFQSQAGA